MQRWIKTSCIWAVFWWMFHGRNCMQFLFPSWHTSWIQSCNNFLSPNAPKWSPELLQLSTWIGTALHIGLRTFLSLVISFDDNRLTRVQPCSSVYSGIHHILCCVFVLFFCVLCALCCQFLGIVHCDCPSVFSNLYC